MTKADSLRLIADEVHALTESPLYEYRVRNGYLPVIGEGSSDAKIVFVGEAPGKNEAKTGKPFCGAAGRVLDQLLAHIGITRQSIYITNIIKDRPPENRDPTEKEIRIYGPFLDRQIELIKPRVIVALGRYAMRYIMSRFNLDHELQSISTAHGKAYHATTNYGDVDIVVLYHPCVAVYNPNNLPNLKKDMEIIKRYM